jgi:hypothetical protein
VLSTSRFPPVSAFAPPPHKVEKCRLSSTELSEYQAALAGLERELHRAAGEGVELTLHEGFDVSVPKGRIPSEKELEAICQEGRTDARIQFDLIENGCAERAHLFAQKLRVAQINVEKVFVEPGHEGCLGPAKDPGAWQYHVGVLVFVRTPAGKVEPRVVDLALDPKPQTFASWFKRFNHGSELWVELQHRRQFRRPNSLDFTQDKFEKTVARAAKSLRGLQREELGMRQLRAETEKLARARRRPEASGI